MFFGLTLQIYTGLCFKVAFFYFLLKKRRVLKVCDGCFEDGCALKMFQGQNNYHEIFLFHPFSNNQANSFDDIYIHRYVYI